LLKYLVVKHFGVLQGLRRKTEFLRNNKGIILHTAIIGLGSDDEDKSEITPQLFKAADMVIVDSKIQAAKFGDVSRALKEDIINQDTLMELGVVLKSGISETIKTIIADFSGIGAQDVAMAEFVLSRLVPG